MIVFRDNYIVFGSLLSTFHTTVTASIKVPNTKNILPVFRRKSAMSLIYVSTKLPWIKYYSQQTISDNYESSYLLGLIRELKLCYDVKCDLLLTRL